MNTDSSSDRGSSANQGQSGSSNEFAHEERLTAYALGELSPSERAEIERHIAGDESASREVASIQEVALMLSRELALEPAPLLTPSQRSRIAEKADGVESGRSAVALAVSGAPESISAQRRTSAALLTVGIAVLVFLMIGGTLLYWRLTAIETQVAQGTDEGVAGKSGKGLRAEGSGRSEKLGFETKSKTLDALNSESGDGEKGDSSGEKLPSPERHNDQQGFSPKTFDGAGFGQPTEGDRTAGGASSPGGPGMPGAGMPGGAGGMPGGAGGVGSGMMPGGAGGAGGASGGMMPGGAGGGGMMPGGAGGKLGRSMRSLNEPSGPGGGGGKSASGEAAADEAEFDSLTDLITETVPPDSWDEKGGESQGSTDHREVRFIDNSESMGDAGGKTRDQPEIRVIESETDPPSLESGQARSSSVNGGKSDKALTVSSDRFSVAGGGVPRQFRGALGWESRQHEGLGLPQLSSESYAPIVENRFLRALEHPLSTFSIDVDTASYSNVRRFLTAGVLPPPGAVRIEELLNYFSYEYPQPHGEVPFSVNVEVAGCPWNANRRLLRIGLKGREVPADQRPSSNLVFLLDVSGSMDEPNKLPLVVMSMKLLAEQLGENDRVAIVVYAGASGLVLPSTNGTRKGEIISALDQLRAGGSTNGAEGLQLAYEVAKANFIQGGVNRVVLATDGDFNVGISDPLELEHFIEEKAKSGVFFNALGFGMGNLKDDRLEKMADKGNGVYAYIDTLREARKTLVEQVSGTLVTIAKDVKIQVDFNPAQVESYRLIGYENRMLRKEDFRNDKIDAGDVGAGHTVTALYEITPVGAAVQAESGEQSKYLPKPPLPSPAPAEGVSRELLTVKLRYKQPNASESQEVEFPLTDGGKSYGEASRDFKFAASVASFGLLLRGSAHAGSATFDSALELAGEGLSFDPSGYRAEFVSMIGRAKELCSASPPGGGGPGGVAPGSGGPGGGPPGGSAPTQDRGADERR